MAITAEILTDPVHEMNCDECGHLLDVTGLPAFVEIACPECQTQQRVPTKLGGFLLVDLLGKGGMGAVYRGRDTALGRWVAVKVMQSSFGGNPEFVETFRREAQAAAALNHPNIVQIYSFGVAHGQPYMVMELLEGGRLDGMIAKGELLNDALVFKIGVDAAEGLNAAAAINLIHGDVKPENILLDAGGTAKIVDFGLARFRASKEQGGVKGVWGTPYYIAPEKLKGHAADARSDIYSLGGTLFHALALKPPFDGETPIDVVKARLKAPAPLLRAVRPNINPEIEAIVARMLEADLGRRYPTYLSLLSDMRRVLATLRVPAPAPSQPQLTKRGGKIVLSRKKGGSGVVPPASSGHLTVTAGALATMAETPGSAAGEAASPDLQERRCKLKRLLVAVGAGIGALALIGGGVAGWLAYKAAKARHAEQVAEAREFEQLRAKAAAAWDEVYAATTNLERYAIQARTWTKAADTIMASLSITLGGVEPTDALTALQSNAAAQAGLLADYRTNLLAASVAAFGELTNFVGTNRAALLALTNVVMARQQGEVFTNARPRLAELAGQVQARSEAAAKAAETLVALEQEAGRLVADAHAQAARTAEEREAQAKAEGERRAAEKAAAEKAARIEQELKTLADARKANAMLVMQNQFKQAEAAIAATVKEFKTEEGRTAAKAVQQGYALLVELKAVILGEIAKAARADPANGLRFGWMGTKDVLSADEDAVRVRGGDYKWEAVPPAQMLRFIQRQALGGDWTAREAARFQLGAGFYVYEATAGGEAGRERAAKFVGEALRGNESLAPLAKALMPETVQAE